MKALIPVAGIGTRLQPHTFTTPKALLQVAGRPILGHIVDDLITSGIDSFCFVTGYRGEEIREWAEGAYEVEMAWVEQEEMLGLGHAILTAADAIAGEPVFIILGDTLFEADLAGVLAKGGNSLGVMEVDDPSRFGVVVTEGEKVIKLVEKPEQPISYLAIAGLYHITETDLLIAQLRRLVEEDIRTRGEYQLTDALAMMLAAGAAFRTFTLGAWYDCGIPDTVLATNRALLERSASAVAPAPVDGVAEKAVIIPPVHLAAEVTLEGAVIGPHVSIDSGAVIRRSIVSDAIVGAGAVIEGAVVESSIVGPRTRVTGHPLVLNIGDSATVTGGE